VQDKIPDELTREDHRRAVAVISKLYASYGVTSACEADTTPDGLQGYQDARDAGELLFRAYCHMDIAYLDRYVAAGLHTGFGDSMLRIGGIKQYADGSISERTRGWPNPTSGCRTTSVSKAARAKACTPTRARPGKRLSALHARQCERAIDRMLACMNSCRARHRAAIRGFGSNTARW